MAAKLAGDVRRRAYRTFHVATDAREAVEQYRTATRSESAELACESALAQLVLEQELEGDPRVGYIGAYAALKHAPDSRCGIQYRNLLRDLGGFRASPDELAKVDRDAELAAATKSAAPGPAGDGPVVKPKQDAKLGPSRIESIDAFGSSDSARVVIHLSGPTTYEVGHADGGEGANGWRLYLDLASTKRGGAPRVKEVGGLLERVRVGTHPKKMRVVLDLSSRAYRRVFFLPEPFRVVVDMQTTAPAQREPPKGNTGSRRVRRVVIDPGHGGEDPGAIGPGGLAEKDVTLDIAHRVAPILAREVGIVTMLTRDDDRYVSLEERAARANAFHADLFVSVHCNAAESPEHRGVQTFVLARAKDETARRVAARENATTAAVGEQLSGVVADLQTGGLAEQSEHLALLLQRATLASFAESYGDTPDGGVRAGGFYVLVGTQMPAVLFEASFLSNPREESRLATADYRQKLADGIANAIRAYRDGK